MTKAEDKAKAAELQAEADKAASDKALSDKSADDARLADAAEVAERVKQADAKTAETLRQADASRAADVKLEADKTAAEVKASDARVAAEAKRLDLIKTIVLAALVALPGIIAAWRINAAESKLTNISETTAKIHTLTNAAMGVQLKSNAALARWKADQTKDPMDEQAATAAAKALIEHQAQQAIVDEKDKR